MSDNTFHASDLPSQAFFGAIPNAIDLSICLVNWNTKDLLQQCIESIFKHHGQLNIEVFVIDNASSDGSARMVKNQFPDVHLIENGTNQGFAKANNQGIQRSIGRYILLLNPDTIVLPGALPMMVAFLEQHSEAGAVAARLLNSDYSLQYSLREFPTMLTPFTENTILHDVPFMRKYAEKSRLKHWDHGTLREVDQPAGAAFMVKRSVIETLGDLNSIYHMFFEDVDLCFRIKKNGWKIFYLPSAQIVHHGGQSVKKRQNIGDEFYKSMLQYFRVHYGRNGERKVRLSMIVGSSIYLLYACFQFVVDIGMSMKLARSAISIFRSAFRYTEQT